MEPLHLWKIGKTERDRAPLPSLKALTWAHMLLASYMLHMYLLESVKVTSPGSQSFCRHNHPAMCFSLAEWVSAQVCALQDEWTTKSRLASSQGWGTYYWSKDKVKESSNLEPRRLPSKLQISQVPLCKARVLNCRAAIACFPNNSALGASYWQNVPDPGSRKRRDT